MRYKVSNGKVFGYSSTRRCPPAFLIVRRFVCFATRIARANDPA